MRIENRFFILIYCFILPDNFAFALSIIHRPARQGTVNIPILIEAYLDDPNEFLWAKLFVKRKNVSFFTSIPMKGSGRGFSAEIPSTYIHEQGTHYYIEAISQKGNILRLPENAPVNIFFIKNDSPRKRIKIQITKPLKDVSLRPNEVKLVASLYGLNYLPHEIYVEVLLDNLRVNHQRLGSFITYEPYESLSSGRHYFEIRLWSSKRNLISQSKVFFYISKEFTPSEEIDLLNDQRPQIDENYFKADTHKSIWKSKGEVGADFQFARTMSDRETPLLYPNGFYSIHGEWQASRKDLNIFLGPFLFTSQRAENGKRINRFSMGFSNKPFSARWGTIFSDLTDLSGSGVSLLGLEVVFDELNGNAFNYGAKIIAGQSKFGIEEEEDPDHLGVYAQRVYGGKVFLTPFPKYFTISVQGTDTRDLSDSIQTPELIPQIENQVISIHSKLSMPKMPFLSSIETEYGISRSQIINPEEEPEKIVGHGFYIKKNGKIKVLDIQYQLKTSYIDPQFYTVFGVQKSDLFNLGLDISHNILKNKISLSESFKYSFDNLKNQKTDRTHTIEGGFSINMNFPSFPQITINDHLQNQRSENGVEEIDHSLVTSIRHETNIESFSIIPGLSFSQNNTFKLPDPVEENTNRNYSISCSLGYSPLDWIHFSTDAYYGLNESRISGEETNPGLSSSFSENITTSFKLWEEKLILPLSFKHSKNLDHPSSAEKESDTFTGSIGIELLFLKVHKINGRGSAIFFQDKYEPTENYVNFSFEINYKMTF